MSHKFRNQVTESHRQVVTLQVSLAGFFVVIIYLMFIYLEAKEVQLIRIPPDLRQGVLMRANDVSPPAVFGFTYYIFQQLNNWPTDGENDSAERIYSLQAFLTPTFREHLIRDMNKKLRNGELRNRVRKVQEIVGHHYTENRVLIESDHSWIVWLGFELSETLHGKPVKHLYVQYALRIVRYDVDPEKNPWGMAISDYVTEPKKLTKAQTLLPFKRVM